MRYFLIAIALTSDATTLYGDTPPDQQHAIDELRGIPSNLQKNRDGTVRFVRFSKAIVTNEHVRKIAAFQQLDYLAVVTPNVTDEGLDCVSQLTQLDTVFLSDSGVTDVTVNRLRPLSRLEHLYLDRTAVTDQGMVSVGMISSLRTLSLSGTKVGSAGTRHLAHLINLETLNLSATSLTGDGLTVLGNLPKLKYLSLNGLDLTDADLSVLADLRELQSLHLRETRLPAEFSKLVAEMPGLVDLDLRETNATHDQYRQVIAVRPKLTISFSPGAGADRNALQRYLAGEPLLSGQPALARNETQLPATDEPQTPFLDAQQIPTFQRHVIPLFGRLGCNGRTCHGSFQGKGGFSLSMFGYDFAADLKALTEGESPRVNIGNIDQSPLLNKPTSDDDHGGGMRFERGGWEDELLRRWIAHGAQGVEQPAKLLRFEVTPEEIVFRKPNATQQLKCVAVWEDGTVEDVTRLTRFQTNDDAVADVSEDGLVTCRASGDTYIVSFYDNGISSTQVMMPVSDRTGDRFPQIDTRTEIDRRVVQKLSGMGIVPSDICDDDEFLRRVSLDLAGTLPTPAELLAFRSDPAADKRQAVVERLLDSDAYATWWSVRLADLTGSNSQSLGSTDMNSPAADQWNAWLKRRLKDNVGWDRIAAGIILATSRRPGQTWESYAAEQSLHLKRRGGTDYTDPDHPMHYYWFRSNNQTDTDRALTFGYTFMGVRLQCAQCHKHPFDRWSKQDFEKFARFFSRVQQGVAPDGRAAQSYLKTKLGVPRKLDTAALRRQMYLRVSAEGLAIPWNEVFIKSPGAAPVVGKIPGGAEFNLNEFDDPREPLAAWLFQKDNPYFAPAFVNRIWAHYFGVGIVDPPDDFNMANPPSNKALLNWLSAEFMARGFDIRWLHRTIVGSDTYQRRCTVTESNRHDTRNFARAIVRRLPAETTIDAILRATARDDVAARFLEAATTRKIGQHPRSYQARGIDYSLLVFGKPRRTTSCDCERQSQPTLLQSLYVRNDSDILTWLERPDGWLIAVARELGQEFRSEITAGKILVSEVSDELFTDPEITNALITEAYQRTLTRDPTTEEYGLAREHIAATESTIEGLRDVMWALLNSPEFLTNH